MVVVYEMYVYFGYMVGNINIFIMKKVLWVKIEIEFNIKKEYGIFCFFSLIV